MLTPLEYLSSRQTACSVYSSNLHEGMCLFDDFPYLLRVDFARPQRFQKPHGIFRSHGKQKSAGGLRVEKQASDVFWNTLAKLHAITDEFPVALQPARKKALLRKLSRFR